MRKKTSAWILGLYITAFVFTGCGGDAALDQYYTDMEQFTSQANMDFSTLNGIDPASETAVDDMLDAMDQLALSFQSLANISVPKQFLSIESLADEAGSYMTEAASLYHQAYGDGNYHEDIAAAALENYNRAVKRMDYISEILQGQMPSDDSITITTENDAPGFKEDGLPEAEGEIGEN